MKIKLSLAIVVFLFCIFANGCLSKRLTADQEKIERSEIETYLKTAEIISARERGVGRTGSWSVILKDGKIERRAMFKHVNITRPTFSVPDSYKYEIAAYELNKLLDLDLVPPLVEREVKSVKGSLQLRIEGVFNERNRKRQRIVPPNPAKFQNALDVISVFEYLTCTKRNRQTEEDILIQKEDWKVWRVDFSEAFAPTPELNTEAEITRCSKKLYKNLERLNKKLCETRLKPYLNDEEIKFLLERKIIIIRKIRQLIWQKGEKYVLF